MKYLNFSTNGYNMKLSKIALGTGRFGTRVEDELAFEMMSKYVECGGNLIDTARSYSEWVPNGRGISERTIGKWLKTTDRDKIYICTKAGMNRINDEQVIDLSKQTIITEFQESLNDLDVEYIDIFLLHRDEMDRAVEEIVETVQYVYETGKVKAIGAANWSISRIKKANEYAIKNHMKPFSVIQTWWSLAEYTDNMWNDPTTTHMDKETYEYIKDNNNQIIAMGYTSQARGFFSKGIELGVDNLDDFLKQRILTEKNLKKLEVIKNYCQINNCNPSNVVLGYIMNNPLDGIAMISCSNIEQLDIAMANSDSELGLDIINLLDSI